MKRIHNLEFVPRDLRSTGVVIMKCLFDYLVFLLSCQNCFCGNWRIYSGRMTMNKERQGKILIVKRSTDFNQMT